MFHFGGLVLKAPFLLIWNRSSVIMMGIDNLEALHHLYTCLESFFYTFREFPNTRVHSQWRQWRRRRELRKAGSSSSDTQAQAFRAKLSEHSPTHPTPSRDNSFTSNRNSFTNLSSNSTTNLSSNISTKRSSLLPSSKASGSLCRSTTSLPSSQLSSSPSPLPLLPKTLSLKWHP